MNVKPAAAFAAGLWIGAVVGAAIGAFYFRVWQGMPPESDPRAAADQAARDDEIQQLRQEQARLAAEAQRLRQTVTELKNSLDTGAAPEVPTGVRRVPFVQPTSPGRSTEAWIAEAVAGGNAQSLPRLEELANQNDETALEALALLADGDDGAALTRVWGSTSLSFPNKVKATRYLAATLESNPRAMETLQSLFNSPGTDARLLYAAVDGIANPGVQATDSRIQALPLPRPQPAFDVRVQLLDTLTGSVTDQRLLDHIEHARDELLTRWVQAEPPSR